jgi:hypothetical protein
MRVAAMSLMTALLVATPAVVPSDNPFIGTWKHNLTRSKYGHIPPPGPRTVRISGTDDGEEFIFEANDAEGKSYTITYTASYDDKDYAVGGTPYADAISLRLVDRQTIEGTWKKDGSVVRTERRIISESGKTMTTTAHQAADGSPADIMVYEKQ